MALPLSPPRGLVLRVLSVLLVAATLGPTASAAAQATAPAPAERLHGRVLDERTGQGVGGAEVVAVEAGRTARSDSAGSFRLTGLAPGDLHLRVTAAGRVTRTVLAVVTAGADLEVTVRLGTTPADSLAQRLPAVSVVADAPPPVSYRMRDFERRRRTGMGQYRTDDELTGVATLQDATRDMRGVTLHCGGTEEGGCRIQMVRAPINCQPEYIVDGRRDNMFGPSTPIRDIVGLEVYTGASDVPGEFAGSRAGCGVVVIWTRAAPRSRRAP